MATKKENKKHSMPELQKPVVESRTKKQRISVLELIVSTITRLSLLFLAVLGFFATYIFIGATIVTQSTLFILLTFFSMIMTMLLSHWYFKEFE